MAQVKRLLAALLLLVLPFALSQRVEIDTGGDPDSRLELRNHVLPDGTEVTFYVLTGNPLILRIDDQTLEATHVEVDLERRELRVIGPAVFTTGAETVEASDMVIDLDERTFRGRQVLVITGAIDVTGNEAWSVPGQISFTDGYFSPCSRCGQAVDDYGFRAGQIDIYPGDRLVAHDVTLLIRGRELLSLPFMMIPLAQEDRRPRLVISQGSGTRRAEVFLDWPYVAGPSAYGLFHVRYYADVNPEEGGIARRMLGGAIETQYLGGGFSHRYYTDTASGALDAMFVPSFLNDRHPDGRDPPQFNVRFTYRTEEAALGPADPRVDLHVERNDARRRGLVEYRSEVVQPAGNVNVRLFSQGFIDLIRDDDVRDPSYWDRRNPRRTLLDIRITPADEAVITLGILRLSGLEVSGAVFEDATNPALRSLSTSRLQQAARLAAHHLIELPGLTMWSGMELSGRSDFSGWYYSGGQRLIDWSARASATQDLWDIGSLSVTFMRDVTEGETPFRFDQLPLRERTEARAELLLAPWPWLSVSARAGHIFTDTRNPRSEGYTPLVTTVTLFDNISWLTLSLKNERDLETGDAGNLETTLSLRHSSRSGNARVTATYIHDLHPDFTIDGSVPQNDTATRLAGEVSRENFSAAFAWGYNFEPPVPEDADEPRRFWEPFVLDVTVGNMRTGESTPGFRLGYSRDMNAAMPERVQLEGRFSTGPIDVYAMQRYRLPDGGLERGTLRVSYPGYMAFEASGIVLLPPETIGLPAGEERSRNLSLSLADAPDRGRPRWQIRYVTTFDPRMTLESGETGGRRNTALELRALLEEEPVGANRFSVDLFVDLPLKDDLLPVSYLRRANLSLGVDFNGTFGIQGTLGYRGTFSQAEQEVTRGELTLTDVTFAARVTDDLYVAAVFNDVWDLTGNSETVASFNLQPELLVMWNRCCWALYGSWNTMSGEVRIVLTTPGAATGLSQLIETPWTLPERHGDGEDE